jgi:hypothetical protein
VSCTIIGPGKEYRSAWDKAIQCAAWLESEDATEIYEAQGVIPIFNPITIQDRSSFLETGYETRLGFDVIFTAVNVTESATDSVDLSKTIQSLTEA